MAVHQRVRRAVRCGEKGIELKLRMQSQAPIARPGSADSADPSQLTRTAKRQRDWTETLRPMERKRAGANREFNSRQAEASDVLRCDGRRRSIVSREMRPRRLADDRQFHTLAPPFFPKPAPERREIPRKKLANERGRRRAIFEDETTPPDQMQGRRERCNLRGGPMSPVAFLASRCQHDHLSWSARLIGRDMMDGEVESQVSSPFYALRGPTPARHVQ